jgi:NAD(P)-dependent dehydrogenase (short-subunit alcohol dehydrogenase family)
MSMRKVLVTGATSGIGGGIARAFAAQRDAFAATGATEPEIDKAAPRTGATCRRLDVRDCDAAQRLVEDSANSTSSSTAPASSSAAPSATLRCSRRPWTSTSPERSASVPRRAPG